jgi:hypothetical protein
VEGSNKFLNLIFLLFLEFDQLVLSLPFPVAARSKAWVFGRLLAWIAGSDPTRGVYVCVL